MLPMLYYDAKNQDYSMLAGLGIPQDKLKILNPFDARCVTVHLATLITSLADAEMFANILAPEPPPHIREDGFFRQMSLLCLKGVVEFYLRNAPGRWTLRDVIRAFDSTDTMKAILRSDPYTAAYADSLGSGNTADNILSSVISSMHSYRILAAQWEHAREKISLQNWLSKGWVLILGFNHQAHETLATLNRLIFAFASKLLLSQPSVREPRVIVALDEFPQLGLLKGMHELAVLGREKGVVLILGMQSLEDFHRIYGDKLAETISGQINHKAILKLSESKSAEWASKLFGEQRYVKRLFSYRWDSWVFGLLNFGRRVGGQDQEVVERVVLPVEFFSIKPVDWQAKRGLTGYYATEVNYKHTYSFKQLQQNLTPSSEDIRAFVPRANSHQELKLWDTADLQRLGLIEAFSSHATESADDYLADPWQSGANSSSPNGKAAGSNGSSANGGGRDQTGFFFRPEPLEKRTAPNKQKPRQNSRKTDKDRKNNDREPGDDLR